MKPRDKRRNNANHAKCILRVLSHFARSAIADKKTMPQARPMITGRPQMKFRMGLSKVPLTVSFSNGTFPVISA